MTYYLVPLSFRNILFDKGFLDKCEESKLNSGYYVPEEYFLKLKNEKLC
jgi:hypothetical protein